MSTLRRLPVTHPSGQYDVIIGADLLSRVRQLANIDGPLALVTDSNVGPLYADQLGAVDCLVTIPAGESYKTLASIHLIYDAMFAAGLDRKCTVVALGGGVIGDMAGFAAATYMRGVNFVQCPTSLLAMVDASVGGKTGVDMPQGKNLVGAFKQPTAVLADTNTLHTLPPAELAAGMAEVVKHGLISAPGLFERVANGTWQAASGAYGSLVYEAVQVKRDVVQEDPFEQGRRATLNLGHTFGHAVEQVSQFAVRHGEGVAMGLVAAAHLSAKLGHCSPDLQTRIEAALRQCQLPPRIPANLPSDALFNAMGTDKKKAAGKLRFVLMRDIGDAFVTGDVAKTAVLETLATIR